MNQKNILICTSLLLLPSVNLFLLYTHGLAKILTFASFLLYVITLLKNKKRYKHGIEDLAILFTVVTTSLSVVNSVDLQMFLKRYIEFILPIILFILIRHQTKFNQNIRYTYFKMFALIFLINLVIELMIITVPNIFFGLFNHLIHPLYLSYIEVNLKRDRLFFTSYNESLLPILLFHIIHFRNKTRKIFTILIVIIQSIVTIQSKFRSLFLMALLSYVGSVFIYINNKKNIFIICIITGLLFIFSIILFSLTSYTVFDRFALREKEDILTIESRFSQLPSSLSIAYETITGTGLGNYLFFTPPITHTLNPQLREIYTNDQMPHNYFLEKGVETGILGLFSHLVLIGLFAVQDISRLKKNEEMNNVLILSFWSLFSYAFFNPSYNLTFNTLFFVIRSLII